MPSRLEGLGFVAIEAQCAGLPCLLSDGVPREVAITNLVHFLSLEENPEKWARKILQYSSQKRIDISKDVLNSGYDINDAIKKLENIYMKILNIK